MVSSSRPFLSPLLGLRCSFLTTVQGSGATEHAHPSPQILCYFKKNVSGTFCKHPSSLRYFPLGSSCPRFGSVPVITHPLRWLLGADYEGWELIPSTLFTQLFLRLVCWRKEPSDPCSGLPTFILRCKFVLPCCQWLRVVGRFVGCGGFFYYQLPK